MASPAAARTLSETSRPTVKNHLPAYVQDLFREVSDSVHKRNDVVPERGEHEYGNVPFADETNNKYPIDTPEPIRAAWISMHHKDNAGKYSAHDAGLIKRRIERAAKKHGATLHEDK